MEARSSTRGSAGGVTMGYLGNVLALVPDYSEFDAIMAHGDSLLLPLTGKPVHPRDARQRARRGAVGVVDGAPRCCSSASTPRSC